MWPVSICWGWSVILNSWLILFYFYLLSKSQTTIVLMLLQAFWHFNLISLHNFCSYRSIWRTLSHSSHASIDINKKHKALQFEISDLFKRQLQSGLTGTWFLSGTDVGPREIICLVFIATLKLTQWLPVSPPRNQEIGTNNWSKLTWNTRISFLKKSAKLCFSEFEHVKRIARVGVGDEIGRRHCLLPI